MQPKHYIVATIVGLLSVLILDTRLLSQDNAKPTDNVQTENKQPVQLDRTRTPAPEVPPNLRDENLVAWCIVPFDAKNRGPAERAAMINRIGLRRVAYDWREKHVATFEEEILQYKKHRIEYFAFWDVHEEAFALFQKHGLHPQIWKMMGDPPGETHADRVKAAAEQFLPLVKRTQELGCQLGLYNHGRWGGEPKNMIAVCEYLRTNHKAKHVGIVYNQHHGHGHIVDFAETLKSMKPYLLCLNLNGMMRDGERRGMKILPLGQGELDVKLLTIIRDSGYQGPIGIIGHTQDDVELRLRDNLDGLHWILPQLNGKAPGTKPKYRTYSPDKIGTPEKAATLAPQPKTANATSNTRDFSTKLVAKLIAESQTSDPHRGLLTFASAKTACLSCHQIGHHGGSVGPDLSAIGKQRKPEELVESVLWPQRHVAAEYVAHTIVDDSGQTYRGYIVHKDNQELVIRDPSRNKQALMTFSLDEIEAQREVGTLMPDNLVGAMSDQELSNLLRFLMTLGTAEGPTASTMDELLKHAQAHTHGPVEFALDRKPLQPNVWSNWQHHVNRDRVYDFYAKQADYFRKQATAPPLLAEFPGLDNGKLGHWGNQNDEIWKDARWNQTVLGSVMSGVFHGRTMVPRGVCVRLGEHFELSTCFNPDALSYDAVWRNGFVKFSPSRHGFIHGLRMAGTLLPTPPRKSRDKSSFKYHGFYRHGKQVVFSYRVDDQEILDEPSMDENGFQRIVSAVDEHPMRDKLRNPPTQWPEEFETTIQLGTDKPYAVDTIGLPFDNKWKALLFCGGHAFLPDGSAMVCTMQGDVWHAREFAYPSRKAKWRRFASGLHQALGIVADKDGIFVLGRDQITRLHDLNHDGEADFYECFSNAFETSPAGHDYICGLERDANGNFYVASGNQGLVCISSDGRQATVVATGFRNPDGLAILPDGTITVPCSEGEWTPASMICAVPSGKPFSQTHDHSATIPHYGYRGPRDGKAPALPMAYLPRGLDNSSGGQVFVSSDQWGPLANQVIHLSFGMGAHFLVLRDNVAGQAQGAVVPLAGEFQSGVHRGRFHPDDGQLYVTGMQGWASYTPDDGCFQRVRFTGDKVQLPVGFHIHENGIAVSFAQPLKKTIAAKAKNHFAQCWNYRYSSGYGSAEFSTKHDGMRGHDTQRISSAHVLTDEHTLFIELPELQPVNQLHLRVQSSLGQFHDLFITVHQLDKPFTDFPGYTPIAKTIEPHPIHADLAMATRSLPNPHTKKIAKARSITLETGTNLSYETRTIRVRTGEPIALTLSNPDVVPHNWALIKPKTLERVGELADRSISNPDASLRHFIPTSSDVLAYTNVVLPRERFTIYFHAPQRQGRYPYLCTFPGHWKVMNGVMIVE